MSSSRSASQSTSTTQNVDRRIAVTDDGIVAAEGSTVNVERLDAGLVEKAIEGIVSNTSSALTANENVSTFAIESTAATVSATQNNALQTIKQIDSQSNEVIKDILKEENVGNQRGILNIAGIGAGIVVVGIIAFAATRIFSRK